MIAQWDSSLSVLPVARVQFPAMAEYFKGFFPGWSHSANPPWASVAENGSISPQWVTFSMGHASASRKSPNDAPWETLSLRLSRPISAPLLTVARSWRREKINLEVLVWSISVSSLSSNGTWLESKLIYSTVCGRDTLLLHRSFFTHLCASLWSLWGQLTTNGCLMPRSRFKSVLEALLSKYPHIK